ncbi:MAG: hypothetical protein HN356_07845 [Calditrichaeota bacterium]|nr:hypothetical protein [Calditrichota bacterium]
MKSGEIDLEMKRYLQWKYNLVVFAISLFAVIVTVVDNIFSNAFFGEIQWISGSFFVALMVINYNYAFRWRADLVDGVWIFFPVKFGQGKNGKKKRISFTMEELVRIDIPKFSKEDQHPPLLITFTEDGNEVTAKFTKQYTRELLEFLYANHQSKLGADVKGCAEFWKGKPVKWGW